MGTHTLRKTGYHFAVYGVLYKYDRTGRRDCSVRDKDENMVQQMEDDAITKSARHKGQSCATIYFGIVMTNWTANGSHRPRVWAVQKVSEWQSIYLGSGQNYARNSDYPTQWTDSVYSLSHWFLQKELNVPVASLGNLEWEPLIDLALTIPESVGLLDRLHQILNGLSSVAERNEGHDLLRQVIAQEVSRNSARLQASLPVPPDDADGGDEDADGGENEMAACVGGDDNQPVVAVAAKRQREVDPDEVAQETMKRARIELEKKKNPVPKTTYYEQKKEMEACRTSAEQWPKMVDFSGLSQARHVEGSSKNWVKKLARVKAAVDGCILHCYGSDMDVFLKAKPKLPLAKYTCKNCNVRIAKEKEAEKAKAAAARLVDKKK